MTYFLHHQGEQKGPWSLAEILERLGRQEVLWTDYLYDEEMKDWIMLLDFAPLAENFTKVFTSEPRAQQIEVPKVNLVRIEAPTDLEWYALQGNEKFGPFKYLELVRMLQEKQLRDWDFVWHKQLENWHKISEVPEFQPEKIKALKDSGDLRLDEFFFRRKHKRAPFGTTVIVHDQKKIWKAESVEISAGGCAILLVQAMIEIGHQLHLHFKAGDSVPPFNAKVEVVSRRKGKTEHLRYGLKFLEISPSIEKAIKHYTDKVAA